MSLLFEGWVKRKFEELEQQVETLEAVIYQLKEDLKQKNDPIANWVSKRQEQKRGRL